MYIAKRYNETEVHEIATVEILFCGGMNNRKILCIKTQLINKKRHSTHCHPCNTFDLQWSKYLIIDLFLKIRLVERVLTLSLNIK